MTSLETEKAGGATVERGRKPGFVPGFVASPGWSSFICAALPGTGRAAPARSSRRGYELSRLGLAPGGVYHATPVTSGPVRSYRTFSPLPARTRAVVFLWHFPSSHPDWPAPAPCPVEPGLSSTRSPLPAPDRDHLILLGRRTSRPRCNTGRDPARRSCAPPSIGSNAPPPAARLRRSSAVCAPSIDRARPPIDSSSSASRSPASLLRRPRSDRQQRSSADRQQLLRRSTAALACQPLLCVAPPLSADRRRSSACQPIDGNVSATVLLSFRIGLRLS